jgi:hypothetical protein
MAVYHGTRIDGECCVYKDADELSPKFSQSIRNHSPAGWNWGYGGSGPAQLALGLLLEETGREEAERLHQRFKRSFVVSWSEDKWRLTSEHIQSWLSLQRQAAAQHN